MIHALTSSLETEEIKMTVRELTLSLLCDYEINGKYVNLSLSSHLADKLSVEERKFLTVLLYTAVERKITYDYYIGAISGRRITDMDIVLPTGFSHTLPRLPLPAV